MLFTANPVESLARDPPDIDIWGYAGQDPLFTAPKDLRNLAAAVIPARYALSTTNYCIMYNCCYCPLGIACLALSTVPSTYGLLWWTGFSLVSLQTTVNWSNVQQQYLRQNWPLALRGVVTPASPHVGVWITQDSA
jgi:hypothetical protein